MSLTDQTLLSRLSLGRQSPKQHASLALLVSGLVVGDVDVVTHSARELDGSNGSCDLNSPVRTPFGGACLYPLQAALCSPLDAGHLLALVQRLLALGASPNICWTDCSGEHTALSKALLLRNMPAAQLLIEHGAEPTAALLRTCLLEASRFDQALVHWLLNRGTDVAAPLQCHSSNTTPPDSCAPLPATAIVLRKLRRELHVQHMLGDLGVAGCSTQHASLLQQAAGTLTALLAAGAPPVGAPDPSGAMAAAAAAMQPADWAAVQQAASEPPRWSVQRHGLFPRAFRRTAREVLLVARRGFAVQCGDGGADPAAQGHQQPWTTFYLDPGIVLCIVKHLTPCCQL